MASQDNRPTWSKTFMDIAKVIAERSKDPHTKVGAVLVKDNHVLAVGYNGEPRNFKYNFDWNSDEKYKYVIHAEMNAIINANTVGINVADADLYVTSSPCPECMKMLVQNRIRNIFYLNKYPRGYEDAIKIAAYGLINVVEFCEKENYEHD